MTTARRPLGVSPRRHCGALVVALFNESTRGDDVAELAVLNAMGGRARAEGPRSEATEPTILTAYGSRKPINSATRRCGACSSHALAMLEKHRSRSAGGCMRSAGRNKFNVCWAGLGACSGIFSRRSSHGVRAARYTARDVAPVVTRGADFNGRNAQVDAQRVAVGVGQISSLQRHAKPEFGTGPSAFNADPAPVSPIGDQARFSRGRRPISRSLAGDCFTYAGLERDSTFTPSVQACSSGFCPQPRDFISSVHGVISHG